MLNSYRQHGGYIIAKHFSKQSGWIILFLNIISMCNLTYFCPWCFMVISAGRNRYFLVLHPRCSIDFKFRNYRNTTTKISYECKLISFSSVILIVECTTATQTVVCALPSILARSLQFSIWKNYFRLIVSRSWSESVLLSKTLKNVRIQLQPYCFI